MMICGHRPQLATRFLIKGDEKKTIYWGQGLNAVFDVRILREGVVLWKARGGRALNS
jgi:hypothetical protein